VNHTTKTLQNAVFPQYHYFNFEEDPQLVALFEKDLHPDGDTLLSLRTTNPSIGRKT